MIYLHQARLVILSQPKTGTTALDNALGPRASIAVSNPPQLKHIHYHKFMTYFAPYIQAQTGLGRSDYEVVSVMREPVDWVGSWYRYRTREKLKDSGNKKKRGHYSGNVNFDEFIREAMKPKSERQPFAHVGNPCSVALNSDGSIGCDRIFPYEDLSGLYDLIESRTKKPLALEKLNVSPSGDLTISEETRAMLREAWPFAFALHSSLKTNGTFDARLKGGAGAVSDGDDEDTIVA